MTGSQLMRQIVWKDLRLLTSLIGAGLLGSLLLFGLCVLSRWSLPAGGVSDQFFNMWMLIPALVNFGIPAMLVGTENEDRTLDWLRTLPVHWTTVLASKAIAAVVVWWAHVIFVTLCFLVASFMVGEEPKFGFVGGGVEPRMIAAVLWWQFILLLCGLIATLLVRSPVAAVLLTLPLMYGVMGGWFSWVTDREAFRMDHPLSVVGLPLILVSLIATMARQRMTGPTDRRWRLPRRPSLAGFSPPAPVLNYRRRPNRVLALLWQQFRQVRGVLIAAGGLALLAGQQLEYRLLDPLIIPVLIIPLILLMLGVATSYGDRVASRRGFFAERGLSPTLIWTTRMLPTAAVAALVVGMLMSAGEHDRLGLLSDTQYANSAWFWSGLYALNFLIGVAAGQWGRRASLAFFGAPVLAVVWWSPMQSLISFYDEYWSWLLGAAAVWLFSTWRLTGLMLAGREGGAIWGRGAGYAALAWAVVFVGVFGSRWATTPPAYPRWRASMAAVELRPPGDEDFKASVDRMKHVSRHASATEAFYVSQRIVGFSGADKGGLLSSEFRSLNPDRLLNADSLLHITKFATESPRVYVERPGVQAMVEAMQAEMDRHGKRELWAV